MKYDCIIVGAGPAGAFCAYELMQKNKDLKVLLIDKGNDIYNRKCPVNEHKLDKCPINKMGVSGCNPACSITNGFGGAGAFSDGKFNITTEFGGWLTDYLDDKLVLDLINYVDSINLKYGATNEITNPTTDKVREIERRGLAVGLKLLRSQVRHLGTEKNQEILTKIYEDLINNIDMMFKTEVSDVLVKDDKAYGVLLKNGEEIISIDTAADMFDITIDNSIMYINCSEEIESLGNISIYAGDTINGVFYNNIPTEYTITSDGKIEQISLKDDSNTPGGDNSGDESTEEDKNVTAPTAPADVTGAQYIIKNDFTAVPNATDAFNSALTWSKGSDLNYNADYKALNHAAYVQGIFSSAVAARGKYTFRMDFMVDEPTTLTDAYNFQIDEYYVMSIAASTGVISLGGESTGVAVIDENWYTLEAVMVVPEGIVNIRVLNASDSSVVCSKSYTAIQNFADGISKIRLSNRSTVQTNLYTQSWRMYMLPHDFIAELNDGKITASYNSETEGNFFIVIALYEGNGLKDVSCSTYMDHSGIVTTDINYIDGCTVKAFLWEAGTYSPIFNCIEDGEIRK